jgi:hypothetical protein
MEKVEQIRKLIHDAVSDCCMCDATTTAWLASPAEAEEIIFTTLFPVVGDIPTDERRLSGTLKELSSASNRLKALLSYAETISTEVKTSDVVLDIARCKAGIEILEWVDGLEGDHETDLDVALNEKKEEMKRQLEALEKVAV